jgi:hypothetical protein
MQSAIVDSRLNEDLLRACCDECLATNATNYNARRMTQRPGVSVHTARINILDDQNVLCNMSDSESYRARVSCEICRLNPALT